MMSRAGYGFLFCKKRNALVSTRLNINKTMNKAIIRKKWGKPSKKGVPIFFECTCYAGAV